LKTRRRTPHISKVKADGLHDLKIATQCKLPYWSRKTSTRQPLLLVRPWDRYLLELPDYIDATESVNDNDFALSELCAGKAAVDSESSERAVRLIVHLGQRFSAFLLVQRSGRGYKRIASDRDIITQVKDIGSVNGMMDIRTLEIL